jgi:hypothetical protein
MDCKRVVGCHECVRYIVAEEMRTFRQAIVQFLIEPQTHIAELKIMAMSLKAGIDEWYEPHTTDYKPMFKEE